jgi:hypothetical protein
LSSSQLGADARQATTAPHAHKPQPQLHPGLTVQFTATTPPYLSLSLRDVSVQRPSSKALTECASQLIGIVLRLSEDDGATAHACRESDREVSEVSQQRDWACVRMWASGLGGVNWQD